MSFHLGLHKTAALRLRPLARRYVPGYAEHSAKEALRKAFFRRESRLLKTLKEDPKKPVYRAQRDRAMRRALENIIKREK